MKNIFILIFVLISVCFTTNIKSINNSPFNYFLVPEKTTLIVLGTIQDGGSPHIGCKKDCCKKLFANPDPERKVVSLGVVDPENKKKYIFEATPDFPAQMKHLFEYSAFEGKETPDGIFLTHAHIGHYTGLMYLGKEAMNSNSVEVYTMPRMKQYLENNGPWSQLVNIKNVSLISMSENKRIKLTSNLSVTPLRVPHRDEYSETVGYIIEGPSKKVLFIPDIDKWEKWDAGIIQMIAKVDYAFIDGTFYDGEEINNRKISEVPHPFIIESMELFKSLPKKEKNKIYFIHFNHTNPVLDLTGKQNKIIIDNGFKVARMSHTVEL